jgi:hypothetical protein
MWYGLQVDSTERNIWVEDIHIWIEPVIQYVLPYPTLRVGLKSGDYQTENHIYQNLVESNVRLATVESK